MVEKKSWSEFIKKIWHFLWYEDSLSSWIANIIVAFVLVVYIIYPGLGLILNTPLPVVAVVSGSMEHRTSLMCEQTDFSGRCISRSSDTFMLCGNQFSSWHRVDFDMFWEFCSEPYEAKGITREQFESFRFSNGFNRGDVMIIRGKDPAKVAVGDTIVFASAAQNPVPIIHRVIEIREMDGKIYFTTKGDHNARSNDILGDHANEIAIPQDRYLGTAVARLPFLGYFRLLTIYAFDFFT